MKNDKNIIEIYKVYVNTSVNLTNLRSKAAAFFLCVNLYIVMRDIHDVFALIIGAFLNLAFLYYLHSARTLSKSKFKVIDELECLEAFSLQRPFKREWQHVISGSHVDFTSIEMIVVLLFFFLESALAIYFK